MSRQHTKRRNESYISIGLECEGRIEQVYDLRGGETPNYISTTDSQRQLEPFTSTRVRFTTSYSLTIELKHRARLIQVIFGYDNVHELTLTATLALGQERVSINIFYCTNFSGGSRISRRGGRGPRTGGRGPPRQLHFKNFACQNERIWTCRGGACRACPPRSANEFDKNK